MKACSGASRGGGGAGRGLLTPERKPVHGNVAWPPIRVQELSVSL